MSRISRLPLSIASESKDITIKKLEQYQTVIDQCANILEDQTLSESPLRLIDLVRKKLTEQITKKARVQTARKDIQSIYPDSSSLSLSLAEIQTQITTKKNELNSLKGTIQEIEEANQKIKEKIEEGTKLNTEKNRLTTILNETAAKKKMLENLNEENESLKNEEKTIKNDIKKTEKTKIAEELAEEQLKRLNVQAALDSLRAEEEKRIAARHLFINDRKSQLKGEIKEIKEKKNEILKEKGRVQLLEEEIGRLKALIEREERRKENPTFSSNQLRKEDEEETDPKSKPKAESKETFETLEAFEKKDKEHFNKERIGRLIMLLFSDGLNKTVVENLAEELSWSKQQTDDFMVHARGRNEGGIGAMWVDWLNMLVSD